jgi:hypothetical protein
LLLSEFSDDGMMQIGAVHGWIGSHQRAKKGNGDW